MNLRQKEVGEAPAPEQLRVLFEGLRHLGFPSAEEEVFWLYSHLLTSLCMRCLEQHRRLVSGELLEYGGVLSSSLECGL